MLSGGRLSQMPASGLTRRFGFTTSSESENDTRSLTKSPNKNIHLTSKSQTWIGRCLRCIGCVCFLLLLTSIFLYQLFYHNWIAEKMFDTIISDISSSEAIETQFTEFVTRSFLYRQFDFHKLWKKYQTLSLKNNISVYQIMDQHLNPISKHNDKKHKHKHKHKNKNKKKTENDNTNIDNSKYDTTKNMCLKIFLNEYDVLDSIPQMEIATHYEKLHATSTVIEDGAPGDQSDDSQVVTKPRIVDVFYYMFEIDIFEARMNELKDSVDIFVVIECVWSFSHHLRKLTFLNDLETKKPHLYEKYYLNKETRKIFHCKLDIKQYTKEIELNNMSDHPYIQDYLRMTFLFSDEFEQYLNEMYQEIELNKNDLIIQSDIDEIPRGLSLYLLKNCDYLLSNDYYPISFDLMFFNYDFGCQYNLGIDFDSSIYSRKSYHLWRKPKWRHSRVIRYGMLNNNYTECMKSVTHRGYVEILDKKIKNNINLENTICPQWLKGYKSDYFGLHTNNLQFTFANDGWHLSTFFKNKTLFHKKIKNAGDRFKDNAQNHANIECMRKECVHLDKYQRGQRVYFHEFKNVDTHTDTDTDTNTKKTKHNTKKKNKKNKIDSIYQDYVSTLKYPRWILETTLFDKNLFWRAMFPTSKYDIYDTDDQECNTFLQQLPGWQFMMPH